MAHVLASAASPPAAEEVASPAAGNTDAPGDRQKGAIVQDEPVDTRMGSPQQAVIACFVEGTAGEREVYQVLHAPSAAPGVNYRNLRASYAGGAPATDAWRKFIDDNNAFAVLGFKDFWDYKRTLWSHIL